LNLDVTLNTIAYCLSSDEAARLGTAHVNIITKFLRMYYKRSENEVKSLVQDLINISKGLDVVDLMTYEMKMSVSERKEKINILEQHFQHNFK